MHLVARRQADAEAVQEAAQRLQLLVRGRGVDPVHAGLAQPLQLLGRGDVGQHHEFLDQPVAVEARARRDLSDLAVLVQHHLALRQVEIERAARRPGGEQGAERGVERADQASGRPRSSPASCGLLHLLVGEAGGAAHQAAAEAVRGLAALGGRSASRRTGSRDPRSGAGCTSRWTAPRAASARRGRGNRRCCRASRAARSSARAGPDVVRDVGDRDDQAEARRRPARHTPRRRNRARPRRRS